MQAEDFEDLEMHTEFLPSGEEPAKPGTIEEAKAQAYFKFCQHVTQFKLLGYTQTELAQLLALPPYYVSHYLKKRLQVTDEVVFKISELLDQASKGLLPPPKRNTPHPATAERAEYQVSGRRSTASASNWPSFARETEESRAFASHIISEWNQNRGNWNEMNGVQLSIHYLKILGATHIEIGSVMKAWQTQVTLFLNGSIPTKNQLLELYEFIKQGVPDELKEVRWLELLRQEAMEKLEQNIHEKWTG